jgi:hypothetical protein
MYMIELNSEITPSTNPEEPATPQQIEEPAATQPVEAPKPMVEPVPVTNFGPKTITNFKDLPSVGSSQKIEPLTPKAEVPAPGQVWKPKLGPFKDGDVHAEAETPKIASNLNQEPQGSPSTPTWFERIFGKMN